MGKTKICCFTELWESGGIEAFIFNTLSRADLAQLEIHVVSAKIGESIFTEPLKKMGVKFTELSGKPRSARNARLWKKLLAREKYDVVHLHIFHAAALKYARCAERAGVPVRIAHAHGAGLRKSLLRPLKLIYHRLGRLLWLGSATLRLACSRAAAEFLFGTAEAKTAKNGIDTAAFAFSQESREKKWRELGISDEPVLGHVGRLSSEKNQAFALKVFCDLKRRMPSVKLLLVGDGEDRDTLTALAEELGISRDVIFYGTSDEVPALMSAMDAFIFPSLAEGLGIVAVEAQCSGLPVLCSDGVPEEAHITELALSLPLCCGSEKWSETLVELLGAERDRAAYCDKVRAAGYDVSETAKEILNYYLKT